MKLRQKKELLLKIGHFYLAKSSDIVRAILFKNGGLCVRALRTPANTKYLYNICTTSAQRIRRWSSIVQMLYKCFVFPGVMLPG